jgi:hypothetical protein
MSHMRRREFITLLGGVAGVAAGGAGAAAGDASDWVSAQHVVSRLGAPPGGSLLSALTQSESGDCLRLLVCLGAT